MRGGGREALWGLEEAAEEDPVGPGPADELLPGSDNERRALRRPARRAWRQAAAAVLAVLLLVGAAGLRLLGLHRAPSRSRQGVRPEFKEEAICGLIEADTDYSTNTSLRQLTEVASAQRCLIQCQDDPSCRVWTWGKQDSGEGRASICFLKGLLPGEEPQRHPDHGVVSGVTCPSAQPPVTSLPNAAKPVAATVASEDVPTTTPALATQAVTAAATTMRPATSTRTRTTTEATAAEAAAAAVPTSCGAGEDGVDFWTKSSLTPWGNITSAEECCRDCSARPDCKAWTWGKADSVKGLANTCFFKRLETGEHPKRHTNKHVISGLVCSRLDESYRLCANDAAKKPEKTLAKVPVKAQEETSAKCGEIEDNTDFWTNSSLSTLKQVDSAETCRRKCGEEDQCGAWTWGKSDAAVGVAQVCFLKSLQPQEEPQRHSDPNVKSGIICQSAASAGPSVKLPPLPADIRQGSLWCYALMQPTGYELELVAMQFRERVSIFDCDEYAVYSSKVVEIAPGLKTGAVNSNLKCKYGGEFLTALNTEIFFRVWDKVFEDGRFMMHQWTVKADADCVFLPDRLRMDLQHHIEGPNGVYVNNCKMGLHGPLEVFSRTAVQKWAEGRDRCVQHFTRLCSGPCLWGEDMFIDQCLWHVLDVSREDDWSLLVEDHCDPPKDWKNCLDQTKAAFHPFKNMTDWRHCMHNAGGFKHRQIV